MGYKVSLVISPAKGTVGRLFSVKGRLTEGILEIRPEARSIHIKGVDLLVSSIDEEIVFDEIKEIEAKGPEIFVVRKIDGDEIQFKNVEELISLLDALGQYCQDVTPNLVRKRIVKYEGRVRRWGGK
jgi:hypothetical protein